MSIITQLLDCQFETIYAFKCIQSYKNSIITKFTNFDAFNAKKISDRVRYIYDRDIGTHEGKD